MVVPLFVGREKSIAALKDAMAHKGPDDKAVILLAAQKKAKTNDPTPDDIFHFGTLGHVIQLLPLPDGTVKVLVEGVRRAKVKKFLPNDAFFMVEVEEVEEPIEKSVELEALVRTRALGLRGLRQAQQAHPARDADAGGEHRRPGAAGRHHRRAPVAQAERQAGAARDGVARPSGSRSSTS